MKNFITRTSIILIVTTVFAAGATGAKTEEASPSKKQRQNVVVIHVDDLGWRDLSCMGSPVYETPYIDSLAKRGTLFTSAYAGACLCTPSRAVLLTGSQPTRHGVYTVVKNRGQKEHGKVIPVKNNQFIPKEYPTIGTILTQVGIANGAIGKWHVSLGATQHGFSESKWGSYGGMPINYYPPYELPFLPQDAPDGKYLPEYIRAAGVDFIEKHKDEQFFLYYSTYLPHNQYTSKYDLNSLSASPKLISKYRRKINALKKAKKSTGGHNNPIYAAMIEETDNSVGAVMDKLKELGLLETTLVIFISDNGGVVNYRGVDYTSQLPLREGKNSLYEGGIRVPMIASFPGRIPAGKISDEPVSGIDLYPTICKFIGVKPADPTKVDGEDLSELLFNGKSFGERNLFWNYPCHWGPGKPRNALRRGDWKIHHFYTDDTFELYNLKNDIGETRDLAQSDPVNFARMLKELKQTYKRFGCPEKLEPNPEYDEEATKEMFPKQQPSEILEPTTTKDCYESLGLKKINE